MIAAIYALVLALVLAVAPTVEATCAWVLWESVGVRDIARGIPRGAFETRKTCLDQMSSRAIELHKEGHKFEVQCLPDTIDPRGPKGGGR